MGAVRCIYHDDEHPSMTLYEDRKDFHCHGCGAHGTYYDLLRDLGYDIQTACTKPELVQVLLDDVHHKFRARREIFRIHADLEEFWWEAAQDKPYRPFGLTYPLFRGIRPEVLARWRVDYANGQVLFSSPVTIGEDPFQEPQQITQLRDACIRGEYRHFGVTPKYGRVRYGQSRPGDMIAQTKWLLVEGPFDALAVAQAIVWANLHSSLFVVATGGSWLPETLPGTVYTMFDADPRGQEYAGKATKRYGDSTVTVGCDPGMDPGDLDVARLRDRLADVLG